MNRVKKAEQDRGNERHNKEGHGDTAFALTATVTESQFPEQRHFAV